MHVTQGQTDISACTTFSYYSATYGFSFTGKKNVLSCTVASSMWSWATSGQNGNDCLEFSSPNTWTATILVVVEKKISNGKENVEIEMTNIILLGSRQRRTKHRWIGGSLIPLRRKNKDAFVPEMAMCVIQLHHNKQARERENSALLTLEIYLIATH